MGMLSVKQVAEKHGVSVQAVHYWIADGLKAQKVKIVGKRVQYMIYEKDLERFFENKVK